MAIAQNFSFSSPPNPLPDFDTLTLDQDNHPNYDSFIGVEAAMEVEMLREQARLAMVDKIDALLRSGAPDQERVLSHLEANSSWLEEKWKQLSGVQIPKVHRGDFDVSPVEVPGKNTLSHPYPGFSAAMDTLWPGYDEAEASFLRKHNSGNWFPERIASLGAVFVQNPLASPKQTEGIIRHLQQCHPHFRTVPNIKSKSTVKALRKVLSYYDTDFPVEVVDDKGGRLGFVTVGQIEGVPDSKKVSDLRLDNQSNGMRAPNADISPSDAYLTLDRNNKEYMTWDLEEQGTVAMSKKTTAQSALMPPFKHRDGLGMVAYIGISDPEEALKNVERYVAAGVAGINIETANADRDDMVDLVRRVREKFPDLFIISGTVTNPMAVSEHLELADCVKVGIAEGTFCDTAQTAVGVPNAWAGMVCGAAAEGQGTILLDGWGSSHEFILGMSFHNIRGRQGGGTLAMRAESAMPIEFENDISGKRGRGMASKGADRDRLALANGNGASTKRDMVDTVHSYSEGNEKWAPLRTPSTIAEYMLLCKMRLQSAMSYTGVRTFDEQAHLRQFQERAPIWMTPQHQRRI